MAIFMMSAAGPCSGMLMAMRSAPRRMLKFDDVISGRVTTSTEHALTKPLVGRLLFGPLEEFAHARQAGHVSVDELLRFGAAHARVAREPKRLHAIHDAEVDRLGDASHDLTSRL